MKKTLKLNRIHCVACALNLEDKVREVEGVESVSIDFMTKTVNLEIDLKNSAEILKNVETAITKFDGSIRILDESEEEKQAKKERLKKIFNLVEIALAIVLTIVAFVLPASVNWLKITLYVLAYLCVGYDVIFIAVKNIFNGKVFDENFLMFIATIGALALQEFTEAIAVMLLYSVGEFLEGLAVEKSKRRVKSLLSIKADGANVINDGEEVLTRIEEVKVNDIIRIKPGEKVPLDCKVVEGKSYINTSAITGESKEVFVCENSELLSGSINGEGVLECRVTKLAKDSAASKIIDLVEKATKNKATTERFITRFSKWYTPIVVLVAVLLLVIPVAVGQDFSTWLYRALVFLVVSCPCALIISIPLGYFAGIGSLARNGVLVKGATYIDMLAEVKTVIFDKTGTLTKGDFEVTKIHAEQNSSEEEVLELIAYAENFSNHRIAKSIVKKYGKSINIAWVEDYSEKAGKGVVATLFMEECLVGNAELLKENNIEFVEATEPGTVVYLAKSGEYLGYIIVADAIKEDSYLVSSMLKDCSVSHVSMFTGDNESVAKDVASKLNLDSYYAGLLPEDKVEKLKELQKNGRLAFVGDGINDAPVLATVDVGVSMGGLGSDAAIEASDVVLMTDEPSKLCSAITVSKKTKNIIIENIVFILLLKAVVLVLTALGYSGMWLAIFADVGVALLAVLNSLRAMITPRKLKNNAKGKDNKAVKKLVKIEEA